MKFFFSWWLRRYFHNKTENDLSREIFQKGIAAMLVFLLLFSQTVRFDWYKNVSAEQKDYFDIVSLIVDRETYGVLEGKIDRYARDIQQYLGSTRVEILVTNPATTPAMIAAHNEKLYYEGDKKSGKSQLVGTILIGNIPIAMVESEGKFFPSIFPYTDFEHKVFVYNHDIDRYERGILASGGEESAEIWHGVINPSLGREWRGETDVKQISDFLDKTHRFYQKEGVFADADNNIPPKVFYFDGFAESRSMSARAVFQYFLRIKNSENLAYQRFTKHLLADINAALKAFDKKDNQENSQLFEGTGVDPLSFDGDTLADEATENTPDIHAAKAIDKLLVHFHEIFNKKVLWEERLAVRNAGRYNDGSRVRSDMTSVQISVMDRAAMDTIKGIWDAVRERFIQDFVSKGYFRKIAIADSVTAGYGPTAQLPYKNYFFGTKSETVKNPLECTIARGNSSMSAEFGREVLVEANAAFDVHSVKKHMDILREPQGLVGPLSFIKEPCLPKSGPLIHTFWGGNSLLRKGLEEEKNPAAAFPKQTVFSGFTKPIFSLGGMRESHRIQPPSISQCTDYSYQYTLKQPYRLPNKNFVVTPEILRSPLLVHPEETGGVKFSCLTKTDIINENRTIFENIDIQENHVIDERDDNPVDFTIRPEGIFTESRKYFQNPKCLEGKITVDGQVAALAWNRCIFKNIDHTNYRDVAFHTIPGFAIFVSPTSEEIEAAKENGATPSIPVNIDGYVEFYTKKGNLAKIVFPNFFRDSYQRAVLAQKSQKSWQPILQKERATQMDPFDQNIATKFLGAQEIPENFDWNAYITDEEIARLEEAKNWLEPNITARHARATENILSRSGGDTPSILPIAGSKYEIAYLGLTPLVPVDEEDPQYADLNAENTKKLAIIRAFNVTDNSLWENLSEKKSEDETKNEAECGPVDGVDIWKWPSAVKCWVKKQFPPKILAGKCGADTIGKEKDKLPQKNISHMEANLQRQEIENAKIVPHFTRKHFGYNEVGTVSAAIHNDENVLVFDGKLRARVQILSMQSDGKEIPENNFSAYMEWSPKELDFSGGESFFSFKTFQKNFSARAQIIYTITLADGSTIEKSSEEFRVGVSEEFLQVKILGADNRELHALYGDNNDVAFIEVAKKVNATDPGQKLSSYIITIVDDITGEKIIDEKPVSSDRYEIPEAVRRNLWVYRIFVRDNTWVEGELTLSSKSGKLTTLSLEPTSSAMVVGSTAPISLLLKDASGNAISPDLHRVEWTISGGEIIDKNGEAHQKLSFDIFDSFAMVEVRATSKNGVKIQAKVDDTLLSEVSLRTFENLQVILQTDTQPKIGGGPVKMRIELRSNGERVKEFTTVASVILPQKAGVIDASVVKIRGGISENFTYTPGVLAGKYDVALSIPGVGVLNNAPIHLVSGIPMYIESTQNADGIVLSVRDRYGNLTNFSGETFLTYSKNGTPQPISMKNGSITIANPPAGSYIFEIPEMASNILKFFENGQELSILPIHKITFSVQKTQHAFSLYDDYNARYTVLAGGSFLREAEQILFGSLKKDPKKFLFSESLAATTLLTSPYTDNALFSFFPNGGYTVGKFGDTLIDDTLTIERWYPKLTVFESVRKSPIAEVLYKTKDANFLICEQKCDVNKVQNTILAKKSLESEITWSVQKNILFASIGDKVLLSVRNDGHIETIPGVDVKKKITDKNTILSLEITYNSGIIGELQYHFSRNGSVELMSDTEGEIFARETEGGPILKTMGYQAMTISDKSFSAESRGYVIKNTVTSSDYDGAKVGPSEVDDLGTLAQNPGVGWEKNNRMMLSFAAGDTVGEATKWFHTYTMVNLGDPIAHVRHGLPGTQIEGLDRTIGTQIAHSRRANIVNHFQKDMNNDGFPDIVVQYVDGYLELILNLWGRYRSAGNIAYIPKISDDKSLAIGDFTGDKFADILTINQSGSLSLIANNDRKFHEQTLSVDGGTPILIQQMKIRDMDADGRDDIVYLTNLWELGILYATAQNGKFTKKILDSSLWMTLKEEVSSHWGAITHDGIPKNILDAVEVDTDSGEWLSDAVIRSQVYFRENIFSEKKPQNQSQKTPEENLDIFSEAAPTAENSSQIFARSQYATLVGVDINKKFRSTKWSTLLPGNAVQAEIIIKNTTDAEISGVKYLDSIPKIFRRDDSKNYTIIVGNTSQEKPLQNNNGEYSLAFDVGNIPANSSAMIRYTLSILPVSYGEMLVGDFQNGADPYGDVAFNLSNTCGSPMTQWLSRGPREYFSHKRPQLKAELPLPEGVKEKIEDKNGNGIPDYMETMMEDTPEGRIRRESLANKIDTTPVDNKPLIDLKKNGENEYSLEFDSEFEKNAENMAQEIADGLSCGFWGGSCMSFPINWAPLAPGNDPVVMGKLIGDGLRVNEGIPIFAAPTTLPLPFGPVPFIWPPSPMGAGGYFPSGPIKSVFRNFLTPTLTLGLGNAACFGTTEFGKLPPKGLSPFVPGGNCIVIAKPMNICQGDGSAADGDVSAIGGLRWMSTGRESGTLITMGPIHEVWNGRSCTISVSAMPKNDENAQTLESDIISYMKNPGTQEERRENILGISLKISRGNISSLNAGPLINIWWQTMGASEFELSIRGDDDIANIEAVVDTKNKRIAPFPEFIMEWLTRQTDEITTALLTPPNLTIIPPTNFGQNAKVDGTYGEFLEKLEKAYSAESIQALREQMGKAYESNNSAETLKTRLAAGGNSQLAQKYSSTVREGIDAGTSAINAAGGGLDAIRAAYSFIGKLPFVSLRQTKVNVNVPWILPSELDQYERKLKEYRNEIDRASASWCVGVENTPDCLAKKAKINAGALQSSIEANLRRIEEYRRFPEKLQKYVTWKEKLLYDILCNIEMVEKNLFGWIKDNGVRFQKWAELYVLIKAIAESWQPLLDIFADTNAQCGVCRNERHNSQSWKFKLIKAILPNIPVVKFPRWPDIILDLSDVRLGVNIAVPDFNFRISPIRLPSLPNLSLPRAPTISLTLPSLPVLPPLPELPDLPKLPSLPRVKLPDLPPPPKLPKMGANIKGMVKILKLIAKMYCYYQKTIFIPEWQAGDVIAQRTERQTTLPTDFLDIQFPQFSLPSLREIRINTHLNYELRSDFLAEMAKNAVKPINQFSTDLTKNIPSKVGNDVNIKLPIPDHIHIDASSQESLQKSLKNLQSKLPMAPLFVQMNADRDIFLENAEFAQYFMGQLRSAGFDDRADKIERELVASRKSSEILQKDILDHQKNRMNLLRTFLQEQEKSVAKNQNIIDLLKNSDEKILAASFENTKLWANNEEQIDSPALQALGALDIHVQNFSQKNTKIDGDIFDAAHRIKSRVSRWSQKQRNAPVATSSVTSAGYVPKFDGMYVLTEKTKTQTKLFDYVELIGKKDRVDVVDLDRDGDRDFIFLLGGILYIKPTHLHEPRKIIVRNIEKRQIESVLPEVANEFVQVQSTPGELNISFRNTVPGETQWRMEFFEKYLEWDKVDIIGKSSVPKTVVDLFLHQEFGEFSQKGIRKKPVERAILSGYSEKWFVLKWPKIDTISGDIFVSVSPNRTFITGKNPVNIRYRNSQFPDSASMKLEPYTAYQFDISTEIRAEWGPIFMVAAETGTERYTDTEKLEGFPLIPGMVIASESPYSVRDVLTNSVMNFSENQTYFTKGLWLESEEYNFSIPYPNGYYYARLHHLSPQKNARAGITLLSPLASSDATGPVISLSQALRVPVYATKEFPLEKYITEMSQYTILVDSDNSVDADKNGVFDDDFVNATGEVKIVDKKLILWGFDTPQNREMTLLIRDEYGNATRMPISVEVFAPIPTIETASATGAISGKIDTPVYGEPVDIFRIRASEIPRKITEKSLLTTGSGGFSTGNLSAPEKIVVTSLAHNWNVLPTGVFENFPPNFQKKLIPSSQNNPMHIAVFNESGQKVYSQFMTLPNNAPIRVESLENAREKNVLLVRLSSGYQLAKMPISHQYLPGGAYLTDKNFSAVAAIAKDGNIYPMPNIPDITFDLGEEDGHLTVGIKKSGTEIATLRYQFDFFYTTK